MMSETFMMFKINLLTRTGVTIKTHLQRILIMTLEINHQQYPAGLIELHIHKVSNNLLIQTGVNHHRETHFGSTLTCDLDHRLF